MGSAHSVALWWWFLGVVNLAASFFALEKKLDYKSRTVPTGTLEHAGASWMERKREKQIKNETT